MTLLECRKENKISQLEAARILEIPLRTYIRYEQDNEYGSILKRKMMLQAMTDFFEINEEKGLLNIEIIKEAVTNLFNKEYKDQIEFCYLFGSYAKGYATEKSDIDLCVSTPLTGLDFVGLSEDLHKVTHKKIDLVRFNNLSTNIELLNEIMKDGVKIYLL